MYRKSTNKQSPDEKNHILTLSRFGYFRGFPGGVLHWEGGQQKQRARLIFFVGRRKEEFEENFLHFEQIENK